MSENAAMILIALTIFGYFAISKAIDAWERVNTTYCCDCDEEEEEAKDENSTL